jgi:hypothetical protein
MTRRKLSKRQIVALKSKEKKQIRLGKEVLKKSQQIEDTERKILSSERKELKSIKKLKAGSMM